MLLPLTLSEISRTFFYQGRKAIFLLRKGSSADPGCYHGSRIRIYFPTRIRNFFISEPGPASKNLSILTKKIVFKLSEIWSRTLAPRDKKASDIRFRIRQHWSRGLAPFGFEIPCTHDSLYRTYKIGISVIRTSWRPLCREGFIFLPCNN